MGADNPDLEYDDYQEGSGRAKTNKESFANQRAQYYFELANRIKNTAKAVKTNAYIDPEKLISFSSEIKHLDLLKSELCRIPRKVGAARYQLLTKADMLKMEIDSPNIADSVMMAIRPIESIGVDYDGIEFKSPW